MSVKYILSHTALVEGKGVMEIHTMYETFFLLLRAKNVKKLLLFCVQNSLQNISGEKTHIMPPLFGKLTLT